MVLIKFQKSIRNFAHISHDQENPVLMVEHTSKDKITKTIEQFIRRELKEYIIIKAKEYSGIINESFNDIKIKNMNSRWGSCSSKRNLNFSIYLIFNSIESIDYVIAHEVCHLSHMNHSQEFWNLVKSLRPNYKQERKNLKMPSKLIKIKNTSKILNKLKKKAPQKLLWRLFKV